MTPKQESQREGTMSRGTVVCALLVSTLLAVAERAAGKPGDVIARHASPGPCVTALAFDGKQLWVADRKTRLLYRYDPANQQVTQELQTPGFWPTGLAWDGQALWCVDQKDNRIYRIDPSTGTVLKVIESPARSPHGLTWDGKYLWLGDEGADQILQISTDDGTTIRDFPAPSGNPQGLAFDGTYLWISDRMADEIYLTTLDGEVLFVLRTPGPYATGLAFDGRHLWCSDYQTDSLYQIVVDDRETYARSNPREAIIQITHEVRNPGSGRVQRLDVYFALPENRESQVIHNPPEFEPPPREFVTDRWGQRFAHFVYENVAPSQTVRSVTKVQATVYEVTFFVRPDKVGPLTAIPADVKQRYLQDGEKYMIQHPTIQRAVKEAVGDEKNPYWIARKIYRYLMDKMYYELAGGWNVAPKVLERGNGSCSEYSFVYIAMARAAGLPARYVGSVVVRGDDASLDDVFHRWVEVYLPNYGWIPVDPSGGDQPSRRMQALFFGHLANRFLITTQSGGGSEFLGWTYNVAEQLVTDPKTYPVIETYAEWEPARKE